MEQLQRNLKKLGILKTNPDGEFGPATFRAVRDFQQRYLVDGIATPEVQLAVENAVKAWADLGIVPDHIPHGKAEIQEAYGSFTCKPDHENKWGKGAWVIVDDEWVAKYLIEVNLPVVGDKKVNKGVAYDLKHILTLVAQRGLDQHIKQFGCWAPRHKMHNRKNGLSVHTWAAAVDINQSENPVGSGHGKIDPGIVEIFEAYGWEWGGRWRTSDPMHFQRCTGY